MFASIIRTALMLSGQAGALLPADEDADYSLWLAVVVGSLFFVVLWALVKIIPASAETSAPQSQRTSRPPESTNPRCAQRLRSVEQNMPRALRPIPRRVIRLHSVTPGQSEHEYNVGDPLGTRGSALIRVA